MQKILSALLTGALLWGSGIAAAESPSSTGSETSYNNLESGLQALLNAENRIKDECARTRGAPSLNCSKEEYVLEFNEGHVSQYAEKPEFTKYQVKPPNATSLYWAISVYPGQLEYIQRLPGVKSIEPNEPISSNQEDWFPWNLDRIDERSGLDGLFTPAASGEDVHIYVVDSGIFQHNEFGDRIASGFSSIDGNNEVGDCNGHGTHVASIAVGETVGIARGSTLVPVRGLDCTGEGTSYELLQALEWIYSHAQTHSNPSIVNLSLGGGYSSSIKAMLDELIALDIAIVGAIGNSGTDACTNSLFSQTPEVIIVGASNNQDSFAHASSYGSCLDIIAPGIFIDGASSTGATDFTTQSGTSMSAPHVSGVLATLLTDMPREATYGIVQNLLSNSTKDAISRVPDGTKNSFLYSPKPEELEDFQRLAGIDQPNPEDGSEPSEPEANEPEDPSTKPKLLAEKRVKGNQLYLEWSMEGLTDAIGSQAIVVMDADINAEIGRTFLPAMARDFTLPLREDEEALYVFIVVYGVNGAELIKSERLTLSPEREKKPPKTPRKSPKAGEFKSWTKRISEGQVKFYAKYPQVGQKIQFMVQDPSGQYKEHSWLRIEPEELDSDGTYPKGPLTNGVYFVRTLDLKPGKNRLRILINGDLQDRTITYVR